MMAVEKFRSEEEIEELMRRAVDGGLEGLEIFERFTIAEIAQIYNGIGPDSFPDWLRRIVTASAPVLEPAALIHDLEYEIGGDEINFELANNRFEHNCCKLIRAAYGWWNPIRYLCLNRSRRWAEWCQIFGRAGFHWRRHAD